MLWPRNVNPSFTAPRFRINTILVLRIVHISEQQRSFSTYCNWVRSRGLKNSFFTRGSIWVLLSIYLYWTSARRKALPLSKMKDNMNRTRNHGISKPPRFHHQRRSKRKTREKKCVFCLFYFIRRWILGGCDSSRYIILSWLRFVSFVSRVNVHFCSSLS